VSNKLIKIKQVIKFIVTIKSDFTKVLIQQFHREQVLGACGMEDAQKTTEQEKNEMLLALDYYFSGIPFITNGRVCTNNDVLYAAFALVTASDLVRKWVEKRDQPFGITLDLDLNTHTYKLYCDSVEGWYRRNRLFEARLVN
jgi:hypothetical protein